MLTTDKQQCTAIVEILAAHGVKRVVVSPGSRNAPLSVAFARYDKIRKYVIVDERSAAFTALGMAQQTREPIALVCTSGTALLNYAPAIAEAYYQKLPLIVISADRPKEWIDQDDSQTIRQFEALSQFVKKSYDLPARCADETANWYVNRIVNDAMMTALSGRKAPVHINVQLDEPLNGITEWNGGNRMINMIHPNAEVSAADMSALVNEAKGKKVMIIAGFHHPCEKLNQSLEELASLPNVAILTETISNQISDKYCRCIDRTLLCIKDEEVQSYIPDILITFGGAIVSRHIKTLLRSHKANSQWYVGVSDTTVDCMQSLTTRINVEPENFFPQFVAEYAKQNSADSNYAKIWRELNESGAERQAKYLDKIAWSDMKAFSTIFDYINEKCRFEFSNGTTIRYAQLFGDRINVPSYCNRGVSGIDGSTSTALGASLVGDLPVVFVTGDMSFSYDISGLASQYNHPNLKIIVISNGGGGIFRFIKSTSALPELNDYFEVRRNVPIEQLAATFGFKYFSAENETELSSVLKGDFVNDKSAASILEVKTNGEESAEVLKNFFKK